MAQKTKVVWRGPEVEKRAVAGAVRGLRMAGEHLLAEARAIVPHETGALERSGRAIVDETELSVVVSFDTPYAVRQHEDLTYQHNDGRQAKYLETPATRDHALMMDMVAAQIRRSLR